MTLLRFNRDAIKLDLNSIDRIVPISDYELDIIFKDGTSVSGYMIKQ